MTKNQYEHYMIFVEQVMVDDDNKQSSEQGMGLTAVAVDLSPDTPVTMRQLGRDEVKEEMHEFIDKARQSMDDVNDRMIDQVLDACRQNGDAIPHYGYVDLVEQLQAAPHLLIANMLAAMLAGCAQSVVEPEKEPAPAVQQ